MVLMVVLVVLMQVFVVRRFSGTMLVELTVYHVYPHVPPYCFAAVAEWRHEGAAHDVWS